ncbi:MAG: methyltransferase domain-containing protein [Nitrospirae bacterium]|nr:methyltransferase domain-containing protein [Nitrospirota bacterium]
MKEIGEAYSDKTIWHIPPLVEKRHGDTFTFLDPEGPNWISTDARGASILRLVDGKISFAELVRRYSEHSGTAMALAWTHCFTFLKDAARAGLAGRQPFSSRQAYEGRAAIIEPALREIWIHTNNSCNLACAHCLVSSGPKEDKGLALDQWKGILAQAFDLGARQVYFTGGEPFVRKDIFDLIDTVLADPGRRLVILTNGMLLKGRILERLKDYSRRPLTLQISLDGPDAGTNDPIRGKGSFEPIVHGIRAGLDAGFQPIVTTVVNESNRRKVAGVTRLLGSLGVKSHHLLWPHLRGRAAMLNGNFTLTAEKCLDVLLEAREAGREAGVAVDNFESFRARISGRRFVRMDLTGAGVESLCVYSDGRVFPSASTAGYANLSCGNALELPLSSIWESARVLAEARQASVKDKVICRSCEWRYICGGGEIEHAYAYSQNGKARAAYVGFMEHDPFCGLYKGALERILVEESKPRGPLNRTSGFNSPVVFRSMGDSILCGRESELTRGRNGVAVGHSSCHLSVDIAHLREDVRNYYAEAAKEPQEALCCPVKYDSSELSHIPKDVIDRFYGCGGPVAAARIKEGEVVVDFGSGAGIDCFIAARKVGSSGGVIGVDMTDEMLAVAERCKAEVAGRLGYDVVEFRKGFLEEVPVPDATADLVMSNCVVNLSPDKRKVFAEMWRILKDHGRVVISDIVADKAVPLDMQRDVELRGACISGALTEEEFLAYLERAGFYGLRLIDRKPWKEVEGSRFSSVTVEGYKFEKKAGCTYIGQRVVYSGPFKAVIDEEGHLFPRNEPVEVCTDTAAKLRHSPYSGTFVVLEPDGSEAESPSGEILSENPNPDPSAKGGFPLLEEDLPVRRGGQAGRDRVRNSEALDSGSRIGAKCGPGCC